MGQSLRDHLDQVLTNRRLNRLVDDLELPLTIEDLRLRAWDREGIHQVFDGLEFRVLRDRLFEYLAAPEPEAEGGFELDQARLDGPAVAEWLTAHAGALTGVHVIGHWGRGTGDARGVALATADEAAGYIDLIDADPAGQEALAAWLADPARPKAFHDAKGPLAALAARGLTRGRALQRHRPRRLPVPARPAQLRPGRPHPAPSGP